MLYTNYISIKISYKKREKISGIGDMLGSYCYKYDWKASSSQSTESFDGHTKVIICQANEAHSRILSQQVASLENCWERGAAAVDIIALEESVGKGYFTYLLWTQGAVEALAGRKEIQKWLRTALNPKEMRSWFHLLGTRKLFSLCLSSTSLPHDVALWGYIGCL